MNFRVLFIDSTHPVLPDLLHSYGCECDLFFSKTYKDYCEIIDNYQGVVIRSGIPFDKNIIDKAKELKFIARVGAGMENIDVDYAASKGIQCLNSPEGNRIAVAEHAIGMLLALNNRILIADQEVRKGIWIREENRGIELNGKTLGIIGYGNMGSAFAKRLSTFGLKILAYDKYKKNFAPSYVEECNMEEIFDKSDFVSLHIPLTGETKYLVNKNWISSFRKPFVLLNTARGPIVKSDDLVEALKSGKITGACLDVIEYEETSFEKTSIADTETFDFLKKSEKVILTPHIAGWTHESNIKLSVFLAEKIKKVIDFLT